MCHAKALKFVNIVVNGSIARNAKGPLFAHMEKENITAYSATTVSFASDQAVCFKSENVETYVRRANRLPQKNLAVAKYEWLRA